MLDASLRRVVDPTLGRIAARLQAWDIGADAVTVVGFFVGCAGVALIAAGWPGHALALILVNRLFDGLDGALARRNGATDLGGFLDIVLDFLIYAGVPFGFAVADPEANALAAAFVLFAFMGTGSSFLAFAVMAAKRRIETSARGPKSLYFLGGLTEGTETILFIVACCLFPDWFAALAWIYGAMCWVTTTTRIAQAVLVLRG